MATSKREAAKSDYVKYLKFNPANQPVGWAEKKWTWVPHKPEGFVAAEVLKDDGKKITVRLGTGEEITTDTEKLSSMNPPKFDGSEDCAELSHLNEAAVLHNLRVRYDHDLIYTYSGLFCVAVNPYKRIPIYTDEMVNIYRGRRRNEVAPHIFAISDEAYRDMLNNRQDQSLLITGESGAGKTENTKKVIQYIATIAGRSASSGAAGLGEIETQLLECNPLLEAFGNAKTNRNDNSSRFGKFIRLQFTSGGQVAGASISSYLLEKNRVIFQAKGERSFHIFYQLPAGSTADEKKRWLLDRPEKFRFLAQSGCTTVPNVNDNEEFAHTRKAMGVMGFDKNLQEDIFKTVAGIMWLGNLKFDNEKDCAIIKDKAALNNVATLWGVDPAALEAALVKPRIKAGTEIVATQLTPEKADYSRNALAKATYGKLFLRIVKGINAVLERENQNNFIGVLDIAGFEIFEFNSFEQLCINYTNERLQQFFNNHMFKLEQEEYLREQINWTFIDFGMDSQDRIDLIDKKPIGILSLLEEESFFPKATDETLLAKVTGAHARNAHFKKPKFQKGTFRLAHYAGEVEYDVKGWLEKNRDPLQDDLEICMKRSKSQFVTDIFSDEYKPQDFVTKSAAGRPLGKSGDLSGGLGKNKKGAQFVTVGTQYKEQLSDLMETLYATNPHFVRCILPNHEKKAGSLEADIVLDQLRCNGVLEGIRIARKGFPNRTYYAEFLKRYYLLNSGVNKADASDEAKSRKATEKIMGALKQVDPEGYRFGLTKIFFRAGVLAKVEEIREQKIGEFLVSIQGACRGWLGRRMYGKLKTQLKAAKIVQKNIRVFLDAQGTGWLQLWSKARPIIRRGALEARYKQLEAEVAQVNSDLLKVQAEKKKKEEELTGKRGELETTQAQLEEEKRRREELAAAAAELTKAKEELDKKVDQLKKDLDAEEIERKELNKDKTRLTSQADELDAELTRETKARQALENLKRENEGKLAELQGNIQATDEKIGRLETAKRAVEKEVTELRASLTDEGDAVSTLEKQKKNLQSDIDELHSQIAKLGRDNDELRKTKAGLESTLNDTRNAFNDEKTAKEAHEAASKELATQVNTLREAIEKKESLTGDRGKTIKKLEDDIGSVKATLNEEKEAKANLEKTKRRLETELSDVSGRLTEENNARASLEEAKRNNEAEIARLRVQLDAANSKIAGLEKLKAALESTVADLQSKLEKETQDKDVLQKANKRLAQELDEVTKKLGDRSAFKAEVDRVKGALTKQFNDAKNDYETQRAARDEVDKKVRTLEAEVLELKGVEQDLSVKAAALQTTAKKSESEAADIKEQLAAIIDAKEKAEKRRKQIEDEYNEARRQAEENSDVKREVEAARKTLETELGDIRKKLDEETSGRNKAESGRKAAERELAELNALLEEKENVRFNLERAKQKLEADLAETRAQEENEESLKNKLNAQRVKLEDQVAESRNILGGLTGVGVDTETVKRKEAELAALREQLEKELEEKLSVEKTKRALEADVRNVKAEVEEQNSQRGKSERAKRDCEDELDKLSELLGGAKGSGALEEVRRKNESEINSLGEKLKTEMELREKAEESRRSLLTEVSDLKTKTTEVESERSNVQRSVKKLETEIDDRNSVYKTEAAEKLRAEKALKKLERELKNLAGRDTTKRGVDEAQILKLEDELADLKAKVDDLKKRREELEGKNKTVSKSVADARALADQDQWLSDRDARNKQGLEDQIRKAKDKLESFESQKSELEEDVRKQEDSVVELRKAFDASKTARAKAENDLKEATASLDKLKREMDAEKRGKGDTDRDRKKFEKELEDLRSRVDAETRARDRAEKAKEKAEKEFKEAQRKAQAGELARTDIERQVDKLKEEVAASKKAIDDKKKENDRLESLRKDLERQLKEARTQTDDERRARQRAETSKKATETEVSGVKDRVSESEKSKSQLEDQVSARNSESESLKTEVDGINSTRGKLEELNKDLERDIKELRDRLSISEKERVGLNEEKKVLEDTLNEWKDKLLIQQRKAESLEKQAEALEKEITTARDKANASLPSGSEKILRLEADNKSLQERIDEEQDKVIVKDGEKKELQKSLAELRLLSHKLEDELIQLKENLAKEQKATAELQSRLEGFFVALGKK